MTSPPAPGADQGFGQLSARGRALLRTAARNCGLYVALTVPARALALGVLLGLSDDPLSEGPMDAIQLVGVVELLVAVPSIVWIALASPFALRVSTWAFRLVVTVGLVFWVLAIGVAPGLPVPLALTLAAVQVAYGVLIPRRWRGPASPPPSTPG